MPAAITALTNVLLQADHYRFTQCHFLQWSLGLSDTQIGAPGLYGLLVLCLLFITLTSPVCTIATLLDLTISRSTVIVTGLVV